MKTYADFTDAELVVLIKNKDHAAFTEIYNRYSVLMFYKVNQMLRDEEVSKDLIQDLFVGLWDKSALIQENNNLSGYLYIGARNRVLKFIQRNKLQNDHLTALAVYASELSMETIQDIDERELKLIVQREIDNLPPKMKLIFEMSRKDDLSHAEIAEKLGLSDQTVKKQVNNALKILRTKLSAYAPLGLIILELSKKG
ncbi:ECF RNA polymerase sigma factor RpoE [compost metagenome]|uniref:RNA polymerase sigma-70 factor n=1 Tax=Pedobacter sp. ok626 TaxID=1761882 RepID=UPI000886CE7D|nr:RNA polymerase sigma-70 factor [Pedobacter sp. ok626]SDJ03138.1 RNA polymerase sigma-70 factor, ECF subfamily [Pedobacter sp. ok626]